MPRRFQFSLRALLLALTAACLWFGWAVERARRRGQAIDSLVEAGCDVCYFDNAIGHLNELRRQDHFWADLKGVPVQIELGSNAWSEDDAVYDAITAQLSSIAGITEVGQPAGFVHPPPDVRKWRSRLSHVLPSSALEGLVTPDWVVEANVIQKELNFKFRERIGRLMPQTSKTPCQICGSVHEVTLTHE